MLAGDDFSSVYLTKILYVIFYAQSLGVSVMCHFPLGSLKGEAYLFFFLNKIFGKSFAFYLP